MTKTIKFIEKEIYINENKIENNEKRLGYLKKHKLNEEEQISEIKILETDIIIYKSNINYLKQIKCELEMWEVVKEKGYEALIKALEAEEDGR